MSEKEHSSRPWREIAEEVSNEQSPARISKLAVELDEALQAEEDRKKSPEPSRTGEDKKKPRASA